MSDSADDGRGIPGTSRVFVTTRTPLNALLLLAGLACVWSLNYEYRGLVYDAQIYAVQALAKLRPALTSDLFLQNISQDQFTYFPRLYAWAIEFFGLRPAALILTIIFTVWLLYSVFDIARALANYEVAWLAVFVVLIVGGDYGAFSVFSVSEPFLTARLPAEALVASALACHFRGHPRVAFFVASAALLVHPLIALPGMLVLICMQLQPRAILWVAVLAILGVLMVAIAASNLSWLSRILPVMDEPWVNVVRERSQFLFLQLWRTRDWALNIRPFLSLALLAVITRAGAVRNLALAAVVIGATGLAAGAISSLVGPVALLMQGQAWRWIWITTLVAILLLPQTVTSAWQDRGCGRVSAILTIAGWVLSVEVGAICLSLALTLWIIQTRVPTAFLKYSGPVAGVIGLAALCWSFVDSWRAIASLPSVAVNGAAAVACVKAIFTAKLWSVLLVALIWWSVNSRRVFLADTLLIVFSATTASILFYAGSHIRPYGASSDIQEFADWRNRIPKDSTVFVTNGFDSGSFVWFTLQRNNYLSPGQSAGVVFSRTTALEVQRRSQVLMPLADPNWKVLTALRSRMSSVSGTVGSSSSAIAVGGPQKFRSLTKQALVNICSDSKLGFVISPDDVGFDPAVHRHPGSWRDWKLYDCDHVRGSAT